MNNSLTHFIRDIYTCIKNSQYIIRFYDGNGGKSNQDILVTGTECETYLCACQWSGLSARWARRSCQIPRRAAGGPSRPGCGVSVRWTVWWHRGPSWEWWRSSRDCACGLFRSWARSYWPLLRAPRRPPVRSLKLPCSPRGLSAATPSKVFKTTGWDVLLWFSPKMYRCKHVPLNTSQISNAFGRPGGGVFPCTCPLLLN